MLLSNKNFSSRIFRTVTRSLTQYRMLEPGDAVLLAVSGGPDSVALLHILRELAPAWSLRLAMAHLNHCLRGEESERDACFVSRLAETMEIPCFMEKADVESYRRVQKLSTEEAARQLRYDFFDTLAREHGFQRIALGHHADDNAELFLMFLLRGSGRRGLSGIPPVREGKYIRPLSDLSRSDICDYLESIDADYVSDSSNTDRKYRRNRLRHQLIPHLKQEYNPNIVRTLHRLSEIIRDEEEWLEGLTEELFRQTVIEEQRDSLGLSVSGILRFPLAARRRIIRRALEHVKGNLRRITFHHSRAILRMLEKSSGFLDLPDRIRIRREGDSLYFSKEKCSLRKPGQPSGAADSFLYIITEPGDILIKESGAGLRFSLPGKIPDSLSSEKNTAYFDLEKSAFPITVRNFQPGDRFIPLGMKGAQKVKKYFADRKIPHRERKQCPILLSKGRIIWLAGHRTDDTAKITAGTEKVLKAELLLA